MPPNKIWTMGEMLVEIMRPRPDMPLDQPAAFLGPFPSGAPAIFIDTVARLGHPAGIIGGVGADDFGRCLLDRLQADGVDCRYVRRYPRNSTAVAFVTYFADGSRKFLYHIDRTPAVMTPFSGGEDLGQPAFFHVMGCSLMADPLFREQILAAMRACHEQGARVSFDPNIRLELLRDQNLSAIIDPILARCAVLLPGPAELALLSGASDPDEAARRLFARFSRGERSLEMIVLKRGKQGCTVYTPGPGRQVSAQQVPAFTVAEVDPTGAGDCFDAAFLCGLLEQRPLVECARMAAAAGALNAAAFGPMEGDISPLQISRLLNPPP